jgi:hypothetical protein
VPGSALAQLDWLASQVGVAAAMGEAIRALAAQPAEGPPAGDGK